MSTSTSLTPPRDLLDRFVADETARGQLSLVQERMWASEKLVDRAVGGPITFSGRLRGPLDLGAFRRAVAEIFRRHEVLRTSFPGAVEPRAIVHSDVTAQVSFDDISALPPDGRSTRAAELVRRESCTAMPLDAWPLVRVGLIKLADDDHVLTVSYHHIVFDGHSGAAFSAELAALYNSLRRGEPPSLPPLPLQYRHYAAWQREQAQTETIQEQIRYWTQQLSGDIPVLELPFDRPRPSSRTFECGIHRFSLDAGLTERVLARSRESLTTPFVTLLSGLLILLHRCTGQQDVAVGSPIANRRLREFSQLVGCFMQPLVLRNDLAGDPTFRQLVERVKHTSLAAYRNQDAPFELVARELRPRWDEIHSPLFQVLFNVQRPATLGLPGLLLEDVALVPPCATLDLTVNLSVGGREIAGAIDYPSELFEPSTVEWLARSYEAILSEALAEPDLPLSRLQVRDRRPAELVDDRTRTGRMTANRQALVRMLAGEGEPPAVAVDSDAPCSFGQERLWFFEQLMPSTALFNLTLELLLEGPLDVEALRRAFASIVERHDVLRTGLESRGGRPVQVVHQSAKLDLVERNFGHLDPGAAQRESNERIEAMARTPFDLARPPLLRMELHRFARTRHSLAITIHHLVGDAWSRRVLHEELSAFYAAFVTRRPASLPPLQVRYTDFARWQRRRYRELLVQGQLSYWTHQLASVPAPLALPQDRPRPPGISYSRNESHHFPAPEGVGELVERLRLEDNATPFVVWLSALFVLLYRYSGQTDMVIDSAVAGRSRRQLESLIGFFVNSLLLRADLSGTTTFRDVVAKVRQVSLDALANQEVPLDKVVAQMDLASGRRGQAVTPVSFVLQDRIGDRWRVGPELVAQPGRHLLNDEFDLTFVIWQTPAEFTGEIQYDPRLFDRSTIVRLADHYDHLLREVAADPDAPIRQVRILSSEEERRLVLDLSAPPTPEPIDRTLPDLVDATAAKSPEAVAVVVPAIEPGQAAESIDYGDLSRRSNQLARFLRDRGVGAESRVGISVDRSVDLIVAVLGVMKSGAAFVAVDVTQGPERARFQVAESRCRMILADSARAGAADLGVEIVDLGRAEIEGLSADPLEPVGIDQLAYLVYTSGSTGRPKAVMVTHRNLMAARNAWQQEYGLADLRTHLQMANFGFDVFVGDLARALGSGAALVLCPRETLLAAPRLLDLIRRYRVECAEFVPAVLRSLLDHAARNGESLGSMRTLIVGSDLWYLGEHRRLRALAGDGLRLVHSYGVAEATIDSSWTDEEHGDLPDDVLVPIGEPFPGTRLLVLDPDLNLVPQGAAGELYIAGSGVARGYADRPALTAQRFLPDPFGAAGSLMYRTGDRVRHLADGQLLLLGRTDDQIKIRGMRVEPGEVAVCLTEHPDVSQAAVVVVDYERRGRQLAAYVSVMSPGDGHVSSMRRFLRDRLPEYMVPSVFVVLDSLPLSPNGKVDRRALPKPPASVEGCRPTAPRTAAERAVAAAWCEVLKRPDVGPADNFFDAGGHSLLLFELQVRLEAQFARPIAIVDLFRWTTVEEQARHLQTESQEGEGSDLAGARLRAQKQNAARRGRRPPARRPDGRS